MCSSTKKSEFTLCSLHDSYNRLNPEKSMSHKCIHKQLQNEKTLDVMKSLLSEIMTLPSASSFIKKIKKALPENLSKLLKQLKVNDIILIDGTEIDLSYSCANNFYCKGKGRPHLDGTTARPGLKLHIAFSMVKQTFEYFEITEAVGSERACVYPEKFKNTRNYSEPTPKIIFSALPLKAEVRATNASIPCFLAVLRKDVIVR